MDIEFRSMATTSDKRSAQQKVTEYREELRNLQLFTKCYTFFQIDGKNPYFQLLI